VEASQWHSDLTLLWSLDVGPVVGRPTVRDGYVWVGAHDSLDSGNSINGGAVAIPTDPAAMSEIADMTLRRELTADECRESLGTEGRGRQSSFNATALGVTFILGSYSATSTTRPSERYVVRSSVRHDAHGP